MLALLDDVLGWAERILVSAMVSVAAVTLLVVWHIITRGRP